MIVALIVFILILLIQLALGLYSWDVKNKIARKFSHGLSSGYELADLVEKIFKKKKRIKFEISTQIYEPAFADDNLLLINKNKLYKKDLYTNFYALFQYELCKSIYVIYRNLSRYQNLLFIAQFILVVLGYIVIWEYNFLIVVFAIGLEITVSIISLTAFILIDIPLADTLDRAKDILEFDEIEFIRAEALKEELRFQVFEYPFEILWRMWQFIRP